MENQLKNKLNLGFEKVQRAEAAIGDYDPFNLMRTNLNLPKNFLIWQRDKGPPGLTTAENGFTNYNYMSDFNNNKRNTNKYHTILNNTKKSKFNHN